MLICNLQKHFYSSYRKNTLFIYIISFSLCNSQAPRAILGGKATFMENSFAISTLHHFPNIEGINRLWVLTVLTDRPLRQAKLFMRYYYTKYPKISYECKSSILRRYFEIFTWQFLMWEKKTSQISLSWSVSDPAKMSCKSRKEYLQVSFNVNSNWRKNFKLKFTFQVPQLNIGSFHWNIARTALWICRKEYILSYNTIESSTSIFKI